MKVLHVITGLNVGGAELQLRSILQHTRHDADVITLYNPGPVADMIRADGTLVRDLGMTRNTEVSALARLCRLIRDGGYDVVHSHLYRSQIYARPAAWLAGTPVVLSTEHSIGETHLERRRMTRGVRALYLATERLSAGTIAVSPAVRDRLVSWGVSPRRVTVIPNGVDLRRVAFDPAARERVRAEHGIGSGDYVIGVLGLLDANKRFNLVIEAAAPLLNGTTKLMIVGQGDEHQHLAGVAAAHGVSDRVVFTGERHDVAAMLSALDLFVASSAQETFGLSVLEALANGAPALYTTCPALTGIDVAGQAAPVPGTADGIRAALAAEISAGRRERRPVPAIEAEYGIAAVTGRIDDLYERLAGAASRRLRRRPDRPARQRRPGDDDHRGALRAAPGNTRGGRPPRHTRRRERNIPGLTEGGCAVKSFVTGAAGFIGSHLTAALLSTGHEVVGLDDLSTGRPENLTAVADHPGFRLVEGSILDRDLVGELATGADRVFHFAAAVGSFVIRDRTLESLRTNIHGTENVVEAAHRNHARILVASTSEIYGKNDKVGLREDDDRIVGSPLRSRWSYAEAKAIDESLLDAYVRERGLWAVIARLFNTVGPGQTGRYGMVIPRFVRQALAGEPLTVFGTGEQVRCFCHVHDVVPALTALIETDQACGRAVNLGSSEQVSIGELARRVIRLTGSASEIKRLSYLEVLGSGYEDLMRRVPDCALAGDLVGFKATRTLEDILRAVIDEQASRGGEVMAPPIPLAAPTAAAGS